MTARECELFEGLAGAELETLGYERRFAKVSGEIASVAHECETMWHRWIGAAVRARSGARASADSWGLAGLR